MRKGVMIHCWLVLCAVVCLCTSARADQRIYGFCQTGGQSVNTAGVLSTTQVQASYPSCTVTVFNTGTAVLATIYSDNSRTPKANAFTAASDGSWFFYIPSGVRVDIQLSNGTPAFPAPVTLGDVLANDTASGPIVNQCALSFSATPTFNAGSCGIFSMTLTANVTSSTITGGTAGQIIAFSFIQGAGGPWTLAWPASFVNPPVFTSVAAKSEQCTFVLLADTNWHNLGCGEFPLNQIAALTGSGNTGVLQTSPTINTPTITSPSITGTVGGGASYTSPTITGTVAGGASYTAPTITNPTVTGGGSLAGTFTGNPTFSGNPVFSGTPSFTGGSTINFTPGISITGTFAANGAAQFFNNITLFPALNGGISLVPENTAFSASITVPSLNGTLGMRSGGMQYQFGCNGTATASATLFLQGPGGTPTTCTGTTQSVVPIAVVSGTLKNFRVRCGTAGIAGGSGAFTVLVSGAPSALTCTVGTGLSCSDTSDSVAVAASNPVQVRFTTQGGETLADCTASVGQQ